MKRGGGIYMELREVKYFIAIAEEKNLSQAAKKLYISQPALSAFLAKMENQSNTKFFERSSNNSLKLTQAGKVFLEGSRKIMGIYSDMEKQVRELSSDIPQTITIGMTDERFFRVVVRSIPLIKAIHPNAHIHTVLYPVSELHKKVANGELDFAHSAYIEEERDSSFEYIKLTDVEVDLVTPLDHPLSKYSFLNSMTAERITIDKVKDSPMVLLEHSTILRKIEDNYFEQHGFSPNVNALVNTSYATLNIVETGLFLGLCPESFHSDRVAYIRLNPPLHYISGIYYRKNSYLTKTMYDFIDILKKTSQENISLPPEKID